MTSIATVWHGTVRHTWRKTIFFFFTRQSYVITHDVAAGSPGHYLNVSQCLNSLSSNKVCPCKLPRFGQQRAGPGDAWPITWHRLSQRARKTENVPTNGRRWTFVTKASRCPGKHVTAPYRSSFPSGVRVLGKRSTVTVLSEPPYKNKIYVHDGVPPTVRVRTTRYVLRTSPMSSRQAAE